MDASQYPGYPANYWYPQTHSTPHYANNFPSGTEIQPAYNPQAVQGTYPNGHGGVYNPGQGHYPTSNFHPSNPFYCADQMAQRPAPGPYPNQGCPPEQTAAGSGQPHAQHHHYPVPHCQGAPGYPPGSYAHYNEGGHAMPPNPPYPAGQALHPRPQAESWGHPSGYGPSPQQWPPAQQPGQQPGPPQQQQQHPQQHPQHPQHPQQQHPQQQHPQNHYGNPVRPQHPPAWPGTGTGAPPPYQPKDQTAQNPQPAGPKPQPAPNPASGKPSEFCSPPQLYNRTGRGGGGGGPSEPNSSQGQPPPSVPSPAPQPPPQAAPPQGHGLIGPQMPKEGPNMARVQQVMVRVMLLQEDVDEFVGKKTDKTYRYLEELLTKELLALDSVETQGQEAVRQARREAVQRIQAILDRLEKKAF